MKNFLVSLIMMALIFVGSSFSVDSINDDSNTIIKGVILLSTILVLYFLVEFVNKKVEITTKNVYKKFRSMAKYLPALEHTRVKIMRVYSGKADGEVMIFRPERVLEHKRILKDTETFSAECLLLDASVVYLYITRDGDMIDVVLGEKEVNADCIFSFEPEKMIQMDGTEVLISATS